MKVLEERRNLEVSGDFESAEYTIAANPMAFRILFNNIYSDKVTAIIRELSTNAYDSHVAAGKGDAPFTVHLPNSLEPYFAVIDDGIGMSDAFIMGEWKEENGERKFVPGTYNRFFLSDKTHTNDQTGCMGLGSKSPFAYTDSFTVISRYNGQQTTYNPVINDKAKPTVIRVMSEPTDKPNGVEVRFSVKTADFWEFTDKAKEVLSWFKIRPNVVGSANFAFNDRTYLRKTDRYGVLKSHKNWNERSHVVMGNVAYQINSDDFRASKSELSSLERQVLDWGVDLFITIGTVQITPSREALSYDPKTAATIKQHLSEVIKDIEVEIEKQIAQAPTLWQARRALHDAKFSVLGKIRELGSIQWNGKNLTENVPINAKDPEAPVVYFVEKRKTKYMNERTHTIHADDIPKFVNDIPHGGRAAVVRHLTEQGIDKAYMIEDVDAKKKMVHANKQNGVSRELAMWLVETGLVEVMKYTSSIPKAERAKRTYTPRKPGSRATLSELVNSGSHLASEYWKPAEVDMKDGGVYLEISHYYCLRKNGSSNAENFHPRQLDNMLKLLGQLGDNTPVYGIRPGDVDKLQKHGRWIHFDQFLREVLEKNKGLQEQVKLIKQYGCVGDAQRVITIADKCGLSDTSPFGALAVQIKEAHKATQNEKAVAFMKLAEHFGVYQQTGKADDLAKAKEKVFAMYPLLAHISWWSSHDSKFVTAVADYISALDGQRALAEYISRQQKAC